MHRGVARDRGTRVAQRSGELLLRLPRGGGDRDPGKELVWLIQTRRIRFWPPLCAVGPSEIRNSVFRMGELAIIKPAYAVHTPGRKERKFPVLLG